MSKQSPIRDQFNDDQIRAAYELSPGDFKVMARRLGYAVCGGECTGIPPSRQLVRAWCVELGLHKPKHRKPVEVPPKGPRVLLIDIETAPVMAYVWSLWKQNVGLNQIAREWNILSFCAKWLHEPEIIYHDIRETPHDDTPLMQPLWDLLNEADIIIGQNGKRFDMPKIQARLVMAGFRPPRPYKVIDTLLMARQQFMFTSNKLEWMTGDSANLTEVSKSKHAKFPGFMLWAECMKGNPEAWDEMREYNIPDVTSMEELYLKLRPWYVGHPNVAVYKDTDKMACPKCGSHDLQQDGHTFTQSGKYELYLCNSCHGWSRGRYTRNSTAVRKSTLSN
ncbi:exonuclease [Pseudomonas phage phiB1_1]|uniref:Exonuclease n=1 Tax=Pseudomonas phage phiB1_1 TaxID=2755402 RepID=A0A7D7JI42_9CAUD|nr:exonuclease [Pseudomonas phage phiB1_1]